MNYNQLEVNNDIAKVIPEKPIKLMDQFRFFIRAKNYALKTEKTYCYWVVSFIRFHKLRHPKEMGANEIDQYLSHLAVNEHVSINTQKTALNALIFLFTKYLKIKIEKLDFRYSKQTVRLPTVFSHNEAVSIINDLTGSTALAV
ncbi:site-specific integrase [Marinicellulosiphila megalodicopiae]|uniref:site-specific integrase n=1 Tax=Marinicellulosiphila megalodicopiae TaxID=2724896 RepID=UPI003BAF690D